MRRRRTCRIGQRQLEAALFRLTTEDSRDNRRLFLAVIWKPQLATDFLEPLAWQPAQNLIQRHPVRQPSGLDQIFTNPTVPHQKLKPTSEVLKFRQCQCL